MKYKRKTLTKEEAEALFKSGGTDGIIKLDEEG